MCSTAIQYLLTFVVAWLFPLLLCSWVCDVGLVSALAQGCFECCTRCFECCTPQVACRALWCMLYAVCTGLGRWLRPVLCWKYVLRCSIVRCLRHGAPGCSMMHRIVHAVCVAGQGRLTGRPRRTRSPRGSGHPRHGLGSHSLGLVATMVASSMRDSTERSHRFCAWRACLGRGGEQELFSFRSCGVRKRSW